MAARGNSVRMWALVWAIVPVLVGFAVFVALSNVPRGQAQGYPVEPASPTATVTPTPTTPPAVGNCPVPPPLGTGSVIWNCRVFEVSDAVLRVRVEYRRPDTGATDVYLGARLYGGAPEWFTSGPIQAEATYGVLVVEIRFDGAGAPPSVETSGFDVYLHAEGEEPSHTVTVAHPKTWRRPAEVTYTPTHSPTPTSTPTPQPTPTAESESTATCGDGTVPLAVCPNRLYHPLVGRGRDPITRPVPYPVP